MTDQTIFSQTPVETAAPVVAPVAPVIPQEVTEYIGEGKKYKSVDEALKSVPHAQNHIKTLSEELAAAKSELEKRRTAEELLAEIKAGTTQSVVTPTSNVDPDSITKAVEQAFTKKQQEQEANTNTKKVAQAFEGKFADKAEEIYNSLAKESGLSIQMLNALAATSPTAVLKMAGLLEKQTESVGKPSSSINTSGLKTTPNNNEISSRVRQGAGTKEVVAAWRNAGIKVGKQS